MVQDVVRQIFLPWFNSYRFLIQNISRYETTNDCNFMYDSSMMKDIKDPNLMDKWITSAAQSLIKYVRVEMDTYKLYKKYIQTISELGRFERAFPEFQPTRKRIT